MYSNMEKLHDHQSTSSRMTHIEAKSINIWLRYDPKCNLSFCKECGHEVGLHFGSYLSQMLMDFDSIWLILKLTVPYEYNGCDIRMSGYPFTGKIIRMCGYSSHSLEALLGMHGSTFEGKEQVRQVLTSEKALYSYCTASLLSWQVSQ